MELGASKKTAGGEDMRLLLASVTFTVCATGAWANDTKRDCLEGSNHHLRITACSAVIDVNPNDATAYYTRAVAYQLKGEVDHAISDYTKAIELNPYHAAAYDGRGRAYASKGNYTNAVADVTKASKLVATSAHQPNKVEVGLTKASELAPTSTSPPKEIAAEGNPKKKGSTPKQEDRPLKNTGPAKEAKTTATNAPVANKASSQPFDGSKPAWAPQAWGSYGQSAN
jgi:tetratricopeptide (TPR) repeat protein